MNYFLTKDFSKSYSDSTLSIKDIDRKQGIVVGYFSAFGNVDADGDMIMPGAFKKSIDENGPSSERPRIKHLRNHDANSIIGSLLSLKEDKFGLLFESKLGRSSLAKDALLDYEDGIITEHSIGFNIIKTGNKQEYRELTEIRLWEGSAVTWGSNENTPVAQLKSLTKEDILKKLDKMTKSLRNGRHSDEYLEVLEIQLKQIQQYLSTLGPAEPAIATPATEPETDLIKLIDEKFISQLKNL